MSETLQYVETVCAVCGQPMHLYFDLEGNGELAEDARKLMHRLARITIHAGCADRLDRRQREASAIRLAEMRTQSWGGICPPRYQDTEPDRIPLRLRCPEAWGKLDGWKWGERGLLVMGTSGTGKTRAVYHILKREHLEGRAIAAMDHTEFARESARMMFHEIHAARDRWLKLMGAVDIFFLDDLGKSRFTTTDGTGKQAEEILWDICETRWKKKLPVIFTTNFPDGKSLARAMSADKGKPFLRRVGEFCEVLKVL